MVISAFFFSKPTTTNLSILIVFLGGAERLSDKKK